MLCKFKEVPIQQVRDLTTLTRETTTNATLPSIIKSFTALETKTNENQTQHHVKPSH
jgi:hypothetical protein